MRSVHLFFKALIIVPILPYGSLVGKNELDAEIEFPISKEKNETRRNKQLL
jgi:hypothetical protein